MHLKISCVDNGEECVVYKNEVPDMKKLTNSTVASAMASTQQQHHPVSTNTHTNNTAASAATATGTGTGSAATATAPTTTHHSAASTIPATAANSSDGLSNGSSSGGGGSSGGSGSSIHSNSNADGIVITLDSCKTLSGDIKVEFYIKSRIQRNKTLFSFWFNTYFVSERENDGKCEVKSNNGGGAVVVAHTQTHIITSLLS